MITECILPCYKYIPHYLAHSERRLGWDSFKNPEQRSRDPNQDLSMLGSIRLANVKESTFRAIIVKGYMAPIRKRLMVDSALASYVLDDNFGVVPSEWFADPYDLFGIAEPPTPFEVLSAIWANHPRHISWKQLIHKCDKEILLFWLLSGKLSLVEGVFDLPAGGALLSLTDTVHTLMSIPSFQIWALGSDISHLAFSMSMRALIDSIIRETHSRDVSIPQPTKPLLEKLVQAPYIVAQLHGGRRLNPIPRAHSRTPIGFATKAARDVRECEYWMMWYSRNSLKYTWALHRQGESLARHESYIVPFDKSISHDCDIRILPPGQEPPENWHPAEHTSILYDRMVSDGTRGL